VSEVSGAGGGPCAPDLDETERNRLSVVLGHDFADPAHLATALTHPSWSYERGSRSRGNERLEFLGDAVIDLAVAHLLYEAHPDWNEGELTRARRALVNTRHLATHARELDLGSVMRLGRGERRSGGAEKERMLGNLFEAVVGAIYLDGGLAAAMAFLRRCFGEAVEAGAELPAHDPKTRFQEWSMARHQTFPCYETVHDTGVENDEQRFTVSVSLEGEVWGEGRGRTKRDAEQRAAAGALALARVGRGA